jgi:hypothetical protein
LIAHVKSPCYVVSYSQYGLAALFTRPIRLFFLYKKKRLGQKKNPHASASLPRNAPFSCRIHAALGFLFNLVLGIESYAFALIREEK